MKADIMSYSGMIGVEILGASSQMFPKKSFGLVKAGTIDEIGYLKDWIGNRLIWLDSTIDRL